MRLRAAFVAMSLCAYSVLPPALAAADGMRCGKNLVRNGHRTSEVRTLCGPPASTTQRVAALTGMTIDEWTYDFGPNEFVRYLRFENDVLVSITTGAYGKSR